MIFLKRSRFGFTDWTYASGEEKSGFQYFFRSATEALVARSRYLPMPSTMTAAKSSLVSSGLVPGRGWAWREDASRKDAVNARGNRGEIMVVLERIRKSLQTFFTFSVRRRQLKRKQD